MEEDIRLTDAPYKHEETIEKRLTDAIDVAGERLQYDAAHNPEILRSLAVVANFIRRKSRVCYGGTAMNQILPDSKKFYNPEVDLPDYDFFTPSIEEDTNDLLDDLKKAGFTDIYHKVGIHEGTKKILVNFIPVADMTRIDKGVFDTLAKRAIKRNGILYTDPDCLRSMMYLEISRPKGMVSRWEKVFERLQLINEQFPVKGCSGGGGWTAPKVPATIVKRIYEYVISEQRILCSGPLEALFARGISNRDAKVKAAVGGPVFFLSPDLRGDAKALAEMLEDTKLFLHKAKGEFIPERVEIRSKGKPVAIVIADTACHSYYTIPTDDGRIMLVASLEMLITLYLSLAIFTKQHKSHFGGNPFCRVRKFIALATKNYIAKASQFPPFSVNCKGYQKGFPSLLREKVLRILKEKAGLTRKNSSKSKSKTRRAAKNMLPTV
jgi:hypothetical protein